MKPIVYSLLLSALSVQSAYPDATKKPLAASAGNNEKKIIKKDAPATIAKKADTPAVLTLQEYLKALKPQDRSRLGFDFLLQAERDINAIDQDNNMTLLMKAFQLKNKNLIMLILKDPLVNVALADKNRRSALHYAVEDNNVETLKELLNKKPALDEKDKDGYTALALAARAKKAPIAIALVAAGAAIDVQDNEGYSPLMYAAENGLANLVNELLKKKANISLKNNDQQTAYDLARQWNFRGDWVIKLQPTAG
jgi:ankyrin repeat protein